MATPGSRPRSWCGWRTRARGSSTSKSPGTASTALRPVQDDEDVSGPLGSLPDDRGQPSSRLVVDEALGLDAEGLSGRHQVVAREATDISVKAVLAVLEYLGDLRVGEPHRPQHRWAGGVDVDPARRIHGDEVDEAGCSLVAVEKAGRHATNLEQLGD